MAGGTADLARLGKDEVAAMGLTMRATIFTPTAISPLLADVDALVVLGGSQANVHARLRLATTFATAAGRGSCKARRRGSTEEDTLG